MKEESGKRITKCLKESKVYIFGAGGKGMECLEICVQHQINIEAFWDNDSSKYGQYIHNIRIEKPYYIENAIVIISVLKYYADIRNQLYEMGFGENNILLMEHLEILNIDKYRKQEKEKKLNHFPSVIQFPITYKCNFNCVMCGMKELSNKKDMTIDELKHILNDKLFSEIKAVGINGGEPFLRRDFKEYMIAIMDALPSLEAFNIISNGFMTNKILDDLEFVKHETTKRNIKLNLSISIDGIGDMQDFHRGKQGAFANASNTIKALKKDLCKYVDSLDVICTITKYNISRINEVLVWSEDMDIEVEYNIATVNRRINNLDKEKDFSIQEDKHSKMLATEFFYCLYRKTNKEKYFAIFLYLQTGKRYAPCPHQYNEWVTVLPDGEIEFCATQSKRLGNGCEHSPYDIVQNNTEYLYEIRDTHCRTCSHYSYILNSEGRELLYDDCLKNRGRYGN
jgi:MoaA/NifB/PqqE/SkfB family radical SAM enzyme